MAGRLDRVILQRGQGMKWWRVVIEGRDYTDTAIIFAIGTAFCVLLAVLSGQTANLPIQIGYILCLSGSLVWPVYVMGRHRRHQDRILDKIRAHYVLAISALMEGQEREARKRLRVIRSLERHWRLGASYPVRLALLSYLLVANTALAFVAQVFAYHINSHMNPTSFMDTLDFLWNRPWLLVIATFLAVFMSFGAWWDAAQIQSRPWAEFYGDQLRAALNAGRRIELAPQHEGPGLPPDGVAARELLGLRHGFTKRELRRAWLRLAKQLHPDKWVRSGDGVRRLKEAALKRVNAARDELVAQAL